MTFWPRVLAMTSMVSVSASAGVTRVLLVVTENDQASTAAALTAANEVPALVARDERLQLIDLTTLTAPEDTAEAVRAAAAAKTAGDQVDALVAQLDFQAAKVRCEEGLKGLAGNDFRAVRDSTLRLLGQLARIKRALKVDDAGDAELAQLFAIDPELQAPRGLNTAEKKAFDAAKARSAALPRAAPVVLEGARFQGSVWVDGRYRGATPVTVSGLTPGRHFLTFVAPGSRVASFTELLGSITRVQLSAQVTTEGQTYRALLASLQAGLRKTAPGPAARELLTWAKAEEVLVVALSNASGVEVARFGPKGSARRVLSTGAAPGAITSAIKSLFDDSLAPEGSASIDLLPPPPPPPSVVTPSADPTKNTTLGKVLLGVGIGAAVAGAAMIVAARVNYSNAANIPQNEDDRYRGAVGLSNGLNVGGIATAGAGVVAVGFGLALVF